MTSESPLMPHTHSLEYGGKAKPGQAQGHRQESLLSPAGKGRKLMDNNGSTLGRPCRTENGPIPVSDS